MKRMPVDLVLKRRFEERYGLWSQWIEGVGAGSKIEWSHSQGRPCGFRSLRAS